MDRSHLSRIAKSVPVFYSDEDITSDDETFENLFFKLELINEGLLGKGVCAKEKLKPRTLLGEYTGSIISRNEAITRMNGNHCHYVVATSYPNRFIDGEGLAGNMLKYVNHKCIGSNCRLVKLSKGRVGLETNKIILPGEYLSFNYRHFYFKGHLYNQTKCLCSIDCPNFF